MVLGDCQIELRFEVLIFENSVQRSHFFTQIPRLIKKHAIYCPLEIRDDSPQNLLGFFTCSPLLRSFINSDFEDGIAEQKQSDKFVVHNIFVSEEHEIFNSLPSSDETVIAAHFWFQDGDVVPGWVDEMKIVLTIGALFWFVLVGNVCYILNFLNLSQVYDCLQHDFIESERKYLDTVDYSLLISVERNVRLDFD